MIRTRFAKPPQSKALRAAPAFGWAVGALIAFAQFTGLPLRPNRIRDFRRLIERAKGALMRGLFRIKTNTIST